MNTELARRKFAGATATATLVGSLAAAGGARAAAGVTREFAKQIRSMTTQSIQVMTGGTVD